MVYIHLIIFFMPSVDCCLKAGDYPLAIALATSGKVDVKPLVSHRYAH